MEYKTPLMGPQVDEAWRQVARAWIEFSIIGSVVWAAAVFTIVVSLCRYSPIVTGVVVSALSTAALWWVRKKEHDDLMKSRVG